MQDPPEISLDQLARLEEAKETAKAVLNKPKGKTLETSSLPEGTIISPPNTDVGPDGFVKKTETPAVTSADDIVERNLKELGYIAIIPTEQGASLAWFSAHPVITLSQFLQGLTVESSETEESGDDSSGLSENESKDVETNAT